ncbi:hypothetical protein HJG60_009454 [Phyllostomus discolor]|uniref:Uncharacterized protein n=1 Tax=Phyllostomus discolor TaxID=89673 RepID=A0A834DCT1_9CHIR|nr:hypothetical protein HJG60_009454 [Phyllostomus discolor]
MLGCGVPPQAAPRPAEEPPSSARPARRAPARGLTHWCVLHTLVCLRGKAFPSRVTVSPDSRLQPAAGISQSPPSPTPRTVVAAVGSGRRRTLASLSPPPSPVRSLSLRPGAASDHDIFSSISLAFPRTTDRCHAPFSEDHPCPPQHFQVSRPVAVRPRRDGWVGGRHSLGENGPGRGQHGGSGPSQKSQEDRPAQGRRFPGPKTEGTHAWGWASASRAPLASESPGRACLLGLRV